MIDTSLIPKPNNTRKIIKKLGTTQDIIDSILRVDKKYRSKEFDKFAKQFDTPDGLKRLWAFVKYQIKYKKDGFDKSLQLTPPALWHKKSGDCKSKTLFVNAVLRGLGIPYIIRFTNYSSPEKDVKHVYTIAIVDGKEIPIDSVYNVFGKEKKYAKKIDYPMAEIVEISGLNSKRKQVISRKEKLEALNYKNNPTAIKHLEVVRQKQQYVKPQAPIPFNKLSEGAAALRIMQNELELIGTFKPKLKKAAEKGLTLIRKAMKGDFSCAGVIPKELNGTIQKIKMAEKLQHRSAISFGRGQHTKNVLNSRIKEDKKLSRIVGAPGQFCLENELFIQRKVDLNKMINAPNGQIQWLADDYFNPTGMQVSNTGFQGACTGYPSGNNWVGNSLSNLDSLGNPRFYPKGTTNPSKFGNTGGSNFYNYFGEYPQKYDIQGAGGFLLFKSLVPGFTSNAGGSPFQAAISDQQWFNNNFMDIKLGDVSYFAYGHKSKYRKTFNQVKNDFDAAVQSAVNSGVLTPGGNKGWYSFNIQTQTELEQLVQQLQDASGILSDQINDIYVSDNSLQGSGSVGSALLYTFLNSTNRNVNDFPSQVQIKGGFQNQYIDSCRIFSGVSSSNLKGMARNGILYNTGAEQPETILEQSLGLSDGTITPSSIGLTGAEIVGIIVAIASVLVEITAVIVSAVNRGQQMEVEAKKIDSLQSQAANFPPVGDSFMASPSDFPVIAEGEGEQAQEKNKNILLLGAGLLGAVALLGDNK